MPSATQAMASGGAAVVALTGCGGDASTDAGERTAVSRYQRTRTTSYGDTTCEQWQSAMANRQRFAAAADMLTAAWNKGDRGTGPPPDRLILAFVAGIGDACAVEPSMSLAEVGGGLPHGP